MVRLPDKSHGTGHTGSVYGSRDKSFAKCITLHFLSPLVLFLSFCFPFSNQKVRFTLLHTFCRQENLILPHLWQKCFPPPKRQTDRQTQPAHFYTHRNKRYLRGIFSVTTFPGFSFSALNVCRFLQLALRISRLLRGLDTVFIEAGFYLWQILHIFKVTFFRRTKDCLSHNKAHTSFGPFDELKTAQSCLIFR